MSWAPERAPAPPRAAGAEPARESVHALLRTLRSGPRGLTDGEAEARLAGFGENLVPGRRPDPAPVRWARGLRDPFTALLAALGVVSAAIGSFGPAAVVAGMVALSCVLRATGEARADRAAARLRELLAATATVRRRGGTREVPVEQLVPGDVVLLAAGDAVPADVRLLTARGLTVHQAAVTGESAPVAKRALQLPAPGDESARCFQGSEVASGSATAVVTATGPTTRLSAQPLRPEGRRGADAPSVRRRSVRRRSVRGMGGGSDRGSAFDRSVRGIAWSLVRFTVVT
ncbi:cation-transporting P-type ATPase, partial [Mangrovactinospora gilvigrisea]|uniref:P-type ATPase n=1 Tax=Mangrovactinospora gilvigrisea TaxID=1428644 RepID=UPI003AF3E846